MLEVFHGMDGNSLLICTLCKAKSVKESTRGVRWNACPSWKCLVSSSEDGGLALIFYKMLGNDWQQVFDEMRDRSKPNRKTLVYSSMDWGRPWIILKCHKRFMKWLARVRCWDEDWGCGRDVLWDWEEQCCVRRGGLTICYWGIIHLIIYIS